MEIKSSIDQKTGVQTFSLSGRFDFHAHGDIKVIKEAAEASGGARTLILNLAGVDYIDSSALGMLLLLKDRVDVAKKGLILRGANNVVGNILSVAKFEKIFTIEK